MSSKITVCGRFHLGPCCVNGGPKREPICMACGEPMTREDRDVLQRTWNTVRALLAPYKVKER